MHIAIFLFLYKPRMRLEAVFFWVLQNEVCSRVKNSPGKYLIRQCRQVLKSIRRIREDYIEFLVTYFQKFKDIMTDYGKIVHPELRRL